jgi:hypothetical protein
MPQQPLLLLLPLAQPPIRVMLILLSIMIFSAACNL